MSRKLALKASGLAVAIAALPLFIWGCSGTPGGRQHEKWPTDHPGPKVVVSFAPLYCFAASVAGDDAVVRNVMTAKGPHDFDPTAADMELVTQGDIFFVVGLGLDEKKAEVMRDGSGNRNLNIVKLGDKLDKKHLCEGFCTHADHGADHKHATDPHVWLSPEIAVLLVGFIRDELKAKDPAHAAGYDARAAAYIEKLNSLKTYGTAKFQTKEDKRVVSFHDSLAYFEDCFKLNVRGVLTKTPGQDPSPKEMRELIAICTKKSSPVRVILTEPQYSTSNSGEALKKELAAAGVVDPVLVEFDPLETVRPDELTPDWYERKMRDNIDRLAEKMK